MTTRTETTPSFLGEYSVTLDAANRLKLPAPLHRPLIEHFGGEIVLQRLPERCLAIYPAPVWDAGRANLLQNLPGGFPGTRRSRQLTRLVGSGGEAAALDGQGRLLLTENYRRFAGILDRGQVSCIGCLDRIEIWSRERWEEHLENSDTSLLESLVDHGTEGADAPAKR